MDAHVLAMSQRDPHRYHTLKLVLEHRITVAQAAVSLGLSPRQIWRLKARLRAECRYASPEWFGGSYGTMPARRRRAMAW